MQENFALSTPLQYFEMLVQRDEPRLLIEAAVSLAHDEQPQLDVQAALYQFERMQKLLRECVPWGANALQRVQILNQFFYEDLGYACNPNDHYAADNSYLHHVIAERRGSQVALGVLWLELAFGIGLTAHGVMFPGHFLVKVKVPEGVVLQDPSTGQALTPEALSEAALPLLAAWEEVQPLEDMPPLALYLQPANSRDLLGLMLSDLQAVHVHHGNEALARAVHKRQAVLATLETKPQEVTHEPMRSALQSGQKAR